MLADTCKAPVSFLMGMLMEDFASVEHDEAVTFATIYLGHDRFIPPMVRISTVIIIKKIMIKFCAVFSMCFVHK